MKNQLSIETNKKTVFLIKTKYSKTVIQLLD